MPSEYEIRAEALRAAVRVQGYDNVGALDLAGEFANWLREGVDVDVLSRQRESRFENPLIETDPDPRDVGHPEQPQTLAQALHALTTAFKPAPAECTCTHPQAMHNSWDGCVRVGGCGCIWDGKVHS